MFSFDPHLWTRNRRGDWDAVSLTKRWVSLGRSNQRLVQSAKPPARWPALRCLSANGLQRWCLVSGSSANVRVNGETVPTGLRVLDHRDAILVAHAGLFFFATDSSARIAPFPGAEHVVHCARCKVAIDNGTPAVCCPGCNLWYHEAEDIEPPRCCYTYANTCAACPQPTDLSLDTRWHPEDGVK